MNKTKSSKIAKPTKNDKKKLQHQRFGGKKVTHSEAPRNELKGPPPFRAKL